MNVQKLKFEKEIPVKLKYLGKNIGRYFLDFMIEDLLVLEVKSQQHYSPKFFKQALSYIIQTNKSLAIIANFRGMRLRYKRVVNPNFRHVDLSKEDSRFE